MRICHGSQKCGLVNAAEPKSAKPHCAHWEIHGEKRQASHGHFGSNS